LNLKVVFFDLLVVDHTVLVDEPYAARISHLSHILYPDNDTASLPQRFHMNLRPLDSAIKVLRRHYAKAISLREEGFVLKPANSPYADHHGWIKLKKDYIPGLGDTYDFCIVGAGYENTRAGENRELNGLRYNTFHVGLLENKDEVLAVVPRPHSTSLT
jgi:ATP dependent DNA ligase domain